MADPVHSIKSPFYTKFRGKIKEILGLADIIYRANVNAGSLFRERDAGAAFHGES